MRVHELKTEAVFWDAVESGEKTFEVRKNDRGFQRGDIVELDRMVRGAAGGLLYDTEPGTRTKKRTLRRRIGFMLTGGQYGLDATYVAFSLEPVEEDAA